MSDSAQAAQLDVKTVEKIAYLARIGLSEAEIAQLSQDMGGILHLISQLQQVDTSQVEPMTHPMDLSQPQRRDEVTETDQHEKLLALAPLSESDLYLVPQVMADKPEE